jgi:threonine aldolase
MESIDLRSDTVTQPTVEMRKAMSEAECGDDVWDEDITVKRLESLAAEMTGKDAAIFTASGTMSNLIAVLTWCDRGTEIIVGDQSHIFWNEVGGASALGGVSVRTVPNNLRGGMDPLDVEEAIRRENIHFPATSMIGLENTHNRCSGGVLTIEETESIAKIGRLKGIPSHLDGARIFNASVALSVQVKALCSPVDSVSFCLSKGLSAPIGSLLCGSRDFVDKAKKWRKMVGGGMRQVGVIASAGLVALNTMVERLAEDHSNATLLAQGLSGISGINLNQDLIESNIVIFEWVSGPAVDLIESLSRKGLKASYVGGQKIRMVTHAGISHRDIYRAINIVGETATKPITSD